MQNMQTPMHFSFLTRACVTISGNGESRWSSVYILFPRLVLNPINLIQAPEPQRAIQLPAHATPECHRADLWSYKEVLPGPLTPAGIPNRDASPLDICTCCSAQYPLDL